MQRMTKEELAIKIAQKQVALEELNDITRLLVSIGIVLFCLGIGGLAIELITFESMVQTSSEITKILNK